MISTPESVPMPSKGPILEQYEAFVKRWDRVLADHFPSSCRAIKLSKADGVIRFGDRVAKVQYVGAGAPRRGAHNVSNEYALYIHAGNAVRDLHPVLRELNSEWVCLELDWLEGMPLEEAIQTGNVRRVPILQLLRRVLALSMRGIVYPQLRARHIFAEADGDFAFIDFGGGRVTSAWKALVANLGISGGLRKSRLAYLLNILVKARLGRALPRDEKLPKVLTAPIRREVEAGGVSLPQTDLERLLAVEDTLIRVVEADRKVMPDVSTVILGSATLYGSESWELIRRAICREVPVAGRRMAIVGSQIGLAAVFTRMSGAQIVVACEDHPGLRDVAARMADLMDMPDLRFSPPPPDLADALESVDLVLCLDRRHDEATQVSRLETLQACPDLVFRTTIPRRDVEARLRPGKQLSVLFHDRAPIYRIQSIH